MLTEKGLANGIDVTSYYRDFHGNDYHTKWNINPQKIEGIMEVTESRTVRGRSK